jgi:TIR domain
VLTTQPPAWDVFISHAHEDKDIVVRPLAHLLAAYGLEVWFDDFSLRLGDPLRASLDKGLTGSRFGVVVLSRAFLAKKWTKFELDSLIQREQLGEKLILPLLFDIDIDELKESSPALRIK